jgi:hypothetical protein
VVCDWGQRCCSERTKGKFEEENSVKLEDVYKNRRNEEANA